MIGQKWRLGHVKLQPVAEHCGLRGLGAVMIGSTRLRHPAIDVCCGSKRTMAMCFADSVSQ